MMRLLAAVGAAASVVEAASTVAACVAPTSGAGLFMPGDMLTSPVPSQAARSRGRRLRVEFIGARLIAVPIEVRPMVRQRSEPLRQVPMAITTTTTTITTGAIATHTEMWPALISISIDARHAGGG